MVHQRAKPDSCLAMPSYQYGSVPLEVDVTNDGDASGSSPRRGRQRRSRVVATWCLALVAVGLVFWISADEDAWPGAAPPLMGQSIHKAQRLADHNLKYLYLTSFRNETEEPMDPDASSSGGPYELWGAPHKTVEAPAGCEATVLILRHCEKGTIREHCDYLGYERSVYLASLFGDHPADRWPSPSYLIALKPTDRRDPTKENFREIETVQPLADKFHLPVDKSFSTLESNKLAQKVMGLLRKGEMCGKLIVIAWKHSKIPHLAQSLGCGPLNGCPTKYGNSEEFDRVWQLKYAYRKLLHSDKKSLKKPTDTLWTVYGSVQQEGFDPLAFSKKMGDYPPGGTKDGGRWRKADHEIPERKDPDKEV